MNSRVVHPHLRRTRRMQTLVSATLILDRVVQVFPLDSRNTRVRVRSPGCAQTTNMIGDAFEGVVC